VEFSDLECPFCGHFHLKALAPLLAKHGNEVRVAYVHFPLDFHEEALDAARTVECAQNQGRFKEAVDFIFKNQKSLGKQPWSWFAQGATLGDTVAFNRCMADTSAMPLIASGKSLGTKMEVTGTPTVLLNGWRYAGAPSDTEITRAVEDLLAGRRPYKKFPEEGLPVRR
jgi:protein-disulfide isomerase